jgi:hypothetical protein
MYETQRSELIIQVLKYTHVRVVDTTSDNHVACYAPCNTDIYVWMCTAYDEIFVERQGSRRVALSSLPDPTGWKVNMRTVLLNSPLYRLQLQAKNIQYTQLV